MDGGNWRPGQANNSDWRNQLTPNHRQQIVNKLIESIRRSGFGQGADDERIKNLAIRYELKTYTDATCKQDYVLGFNKMYNKTPPITNFIQHNASGQNAPATMPSQVNIQSHQLAVPKVEAYTLLNQNNTVSLTPALSNMTQATGGRNPHGPGSPSMPSQVNIQAQQLAVSKEAYQNHSQNMLLRQNNTTSTGLHNSVGLTPAMTQATMPVLVNSNLQTMQNMSNGTDWKEEVYQKIKSLKEMHFSKLIEIYQKFAFKVKQFDSVSHPPQHKQHIERVKAHKTVLEQVVRFLQLNKCDIQLIHKEKLSKLEKHIDIFLNINRPYKPASSLLQGQIAQTPVQVQQPQSLDGQTKPSMQPVQGSPLLADSTTPDGTHANASAAVLGTSSYEQPLERLIKVVKSMSPGALNSAVSDISSVASIIDRIGGCGAGNGLRADVVSSCGLNINDSLGQLNDFKVSELETTSVKRRRLEANHALVEEIRNINRRLIGTIVEISEEGIDIDLEGGKGTTVNCSFTPVALSPHLKAQCVASQMSLFQPLRLLIPANYPDSSVILLDKFTIDVKKEDEDGSMEAKSRFIASLRTLSQPMSLKDIATTWDACARTVISEYAQQFGGGTFTSKYGSWKNCLSAV